MTPSRCVAALAAISTLSAIGTLGFPFLVHEPLALALLSPRLPFLALAGRRVSPVVLVPLATLRLCAGDVFHYELGRRYHETALARRVRRTRLAGLRPVLAAKRLVARFDAVANHSILVAIFVRPIGRHLMVAGANGTSKRRVAAVDLAGTVLYVIVVVAAAGAVH